MTRLFWKCFAGVTAFFGLIGLLVIVWPKALAICVVVIMTLFGLVITAKGLEGLIIFSSERTQSNENRRPCSDSRKLVR